MSCYQRPPPLALCRIHTDWKHEFVAVMDVVGRAERGTSHTAQRATAHHSLLRLASVGLCNSGTGKPTAPLKKREAAYSLEYAKPAEQ